MRQIVHFIMPHRCPAIGQSFHALSVPPAWSLAWRQRPSEKSSWAIRELLPSHRKCASYRPFPVDELLQLRRALPYLIVAMSAAQLLNPKAESRVRKSTSLLLAPKLTFFVAAGRSSSCQHQRRRGTAGCVEIQRSVYKRIEKSDRQYR